MATIAFWGLVLTVALAPLPLGSNRPAAWSLLALAVGLWLIFWAIAIWRRPQQLEVPWRRHWPATLGFLLIAVWALVQVVPLTPAAWHHPLWGEAGAALGVALPGAISIAPADGMTALMRLLSYGGVFWLAMQFGRSSGRANILLWSLMIAATLYAAYGLVLQVSGSNRLLWFEKWAYADSLTATFVNRNSFATYSGLGLIAAVGLLLRRLRHVAMPEAGDIAASVDRFAAAAAAPVAAVVVLAAALLLSHSRGGLLATILGLATLLARDVFRRDRPRRAKVVAGTVLAGLLLLIVVGGGVTLQRLDQEGREDLAVRAWIHAQAAKAVPEAPMTGTGYGSFESVFAGLRDAEWIKLRHIDKAHNTYIELAVEFGLPATLLFLALPAWITYRCLRGQAERQRNAIYPAVAVAASVLVGVHSLFDFSLQIPAVAFAYALILGTGFAQSWKSRERPSPSGAQRVEVSAA